MTALEFRILTPEELVKLSPEERVEYRKQLLEQMRHEIADTDAAIKARSERFEKDES